MGTARAAALVAILGSMPVSWCVANPTEVPRGDNTSRQAFVTAIDALNAYDPQSPETLDARLQYADFLAKTDSEDCRTRLDTAQSQLDLVRASPAVSIALPWGAARQADLEYQIHFARADCGSSAAVRDQEVAFRTHVANGRSKVFGPLVLKAEAPVDVLRCAASLVRVAVANGRR